MRKTTGERSSLLVEPSGLRGIRQRTKSAVGTAIASTTKVARSERTNHLSDHCRRELFRSWSRSPRCAKERLSVAESLKNTIKLTIIIMFFLVIASLSEQGTCSIVDRIRALDFLTRLATFIDHYVDDLSNHKVDFCVTDRRNPEDTRPALHEAPHDSPGQYLATHQLRSQSSCDRASRLLAAYFDGRAASLPWIKSLLLDADRIAPLRRSTRRLRVLPLNHLVGNHSPLSRNWRFLVMSRYQPPFSSYLPHRELFSRCGAGAAGADLFGHTSRRSRTRRTR